MKRGDAVEVALLELMGVEEEVALLELVGRIPSSIEEDIASLLVVDATG